MDADKIYRATINNLATAISGHRCPNGRYSLKAFCECYGFNRTNLCQILLGTGNELSVGLYLRIMYALGKVAPACLPELNTDPANSLSLRLYLSIDYNTVTRSILELEFS